MANSASFLRQFVLLLLLHIMCLEECRSASPLQEYLVKTESQSTNSTDILLPKSLEIGASTPLSKRQQDALITYYRHAAHMAVVFAKERRLGIVRDTLPCRVNLLSSPSEVAEMTHRPEYDRLGRVVARINLTEGIIYLGRPDVFDLYLELGKWFFYEQGYQWGQNLNTDREHLATIIAFAEFCKVRWDQSAAQ